jgi:hypothetical protein
MVSSLVAKSGSKGITDTAIYDAISAELSLQKKDAMPLVELALQALINDEILYVKHLDDNNICNISDNYSETSFDRGLTILEDGVIDRYVVRSAGHDSTEIRQCLNALFNYMIAHRGWDLGAAFAGGNVPDLLEISTMMRNVSQCKPGKIQIKLNDLIRAVEDLIEHPNTNEADVLAEMGRTSFALELVTHSTYDTLFHALTLPERIYLDANVLMPAFTPGHPYHDVYSTTISRLIDAGV